MGDCKRLCRVKRIPENKDEDKQQEEVIF